MSDRSSAAKSIVCLALVLVIFAIYGRTASHPFIDFDDSEYVYENATVRQGLSWDGVVWAVSTFWSANWHPITWISHMTDVQMFGLDAGWHHVTNVALHGVNAVLLFLVLITMTGAVWRSALVAGLFAVHPQHVESVAWIAERKDVLSTCFWLLTMAAYVNFVRRGGARSYVLVLLTYGLGLVSKPMLVTLPVVLLLLDFWPLQRLIPAGETYAPEDMRRRVLELIREKLPLALLAMTSSIIAYAAQNHWQATVPLDAIPLAQRVANALVSGTVYLAKTVYPTSLAIFYPHPATVGESVPAPALIGAAGALAVLTVLATMQWRERPWITVGWLWFLITLAPVIGLVQIGSQALADRYTYVPHIGLFILLVWSIPLAVEHSRFGKIIVVGVCGGVLVALSAIAWIQVGYWRNGVTLYTHAIAVTEKNWLAWNNLGVQYLNANQLEKAGECFGQTVRIKRDYGDGWYNLGVAQARLGRSREAVQSYQAALSLDPRNADGWMNLGLTQQTIGDYRSAISAYQNALQLRPDDSLALQNLAVSYAAQGDLPKALKASEKLRAIDRKKWDELMITMFGLPERK